MFVYLPNLGKIIDSKDIAGVDTTFDVETKHSSEFPSHSTQPFHIVTESVANAHISIKLVSGDIIAYTTVVLPLGNKRQAFDNSSVVASLPEDAQHRMLERVQRCTNFLAKSENHAAMMQTSGFAAIASNFEETDSSPRPVFARHSPHDDNDIKNEALRVKNINTALDKLSSAHTGLDFTAAMEYIDQGSLLVPLNEQLIALTMMLNSD